MSASSFRALNFVARRAYSQAKTPSAPTGTASTTGGEKVANVTGLSSKCVKPTSEPVGPGASHTGTYKVPEYFCFNRFSYTEAELEMAKYRLPQPSALKK